MTLAPAVRRHVLRVGVHGLSLRLVCADDETVRALKERFDAFPPAPGPEADLTVIYDLDGPLHEPPLDARTVYESEHARAAYSPGEDALYAFHAEGASLRCDPAAGLAEIVADRALGASAWVLTRPLLTLALLETLRERALQPLHAAALAGPRGGVLVCGPSGAGKSTLALALAGAGLDYLGDDLALLRADGDGVEVLGFPDEIGLAGGEPRPGWPKQRLPLRAAIPTRQLRQRCVPHLVVVLSDAAGPAPEPVDRDTALLELLPSILLTDPARVDAHLAALAKLTASATLWRVGPRPDLDDVVTRIVAEVGIAGAD